MKKRSLSPRLALLVIAALFILPLALAWLMYSGAINFQPVSTRNLGHLVQPPLPVTWAGLARVAGGDGASLAESFDTHWVVVYRVPERCDATCTAEVTNLRQIHRASGRHQGRLRFTLLLPGADYQAAAELEKIHSQFHLVVDETGEFTALLQQAGTAALPAPAQDSGRIYLIDPLGNIMMAYQAGSDPNDLKQDLKRLLTWSKLDEQ